MLLLGAVRTKIAATLLGPAGVGLLAQATSFRDLLVAIASFGSRNGYLKLVAEHRGRDDRPGLERLIVSTLVLVGTLTLLVASISIAGSPWIAAWAFGDGARSTLVVLSALTVLFAMPASVISRTFSGALDFRTFVQLAIFDGVLSVISMAVLSYVFGIAGAVSAFMVSGAATLVLGAVLLRRRLGRPLGLDLRPRLPDPAIVRRLAKLASALTITSLATTAAAVFVRGAILRELGSEANGYYQVAWQVGQNYLGILGSALWGYGMPKVASRVDDPAAVVALQNQFLRIALSFLAPGIMLLLVTRELWVPILFTQAFLAAGAMLCWQLMGELFAMVRQSMNISLLPRERLGFLVFQAVFYWGSWALLAWLALPWLGAKAAAVAYFAANLISLVVTHVYHHRALGYRIERDNLILLGWIVPVFVLASLLALNDGWTAGRLVPGGMALVALYANRAVLLRAWRG